MVWDREGCLSADDDSLLAGQAELAGRTNPRRVRGDLRDGARRAPTSSSGSAARACSRPSGSSTWPTKPIVFALANPDPEIDPAEAGQYAAVVASGRSDYPNQINNVLAFPGVFRGLLDARASDVTIEMLLRAAEAIAHVVTDDELNAELHRPERLRREGAQGRRPPPSAGSRRSTALLSGPRARFAAVDRVVEERATA